MLIACIDGMGRIDIEKETVYLNKLQYDPSFLLYLHGQHLLRDVLSWGYALCVLDTEHALTISRMFQS